MFDKGLNGLSELSTGAKMLIGITIVLMAVPSLMCCQNLWKLWNPPQQRISIPNIHNDAQSENSDMMNRALVERNVSKLSFFSVASQNWETPRPGVAPYKKPSGPPPNKEYPRYSQSFVNQASNVSLAKPYAPAQGYPKPQQQQQQQQQTNATQIVDTSSSKKMAKYKRQVSNAFSAARKSNVSLTKGKTSTNNLFKPRTY